MVLDHFQGHHRKVKEKPQVKLTNKKTQKGYNMNKWQ